MRSVSGVEETAVHNEECEWSSRAKFLISATSYTCSQCNPCLIKFHMSSFTLLQNFSLTTKQ